MEVAILFAIVVGLMLIGVPIAVSLGMASTLFLLALSDTSLASIAQIPFTTHPAPLRASAGSSVQLCRRRLSGYRTRPTLA